MKSFQNKSLSQEFWGLLCVIAVYGLLSVPRVTQPLTQDEINYFWAAKSFLLHGRPVLYDGAPLDSSPYLFLFGETIFLKVFGLIPEAARLFGVAMGALSVLLGFGLAHRLAGGQERGVRAGFLAAVFFAVTPAFVQGTSILDVDCTVLVPVALAAVWGYLSWVEKGGTTRAIVLVLLTALLLWGRVTTPFIFILVGIVWARLLFKDGPRFWTTSGLLALGVGIFWLSWTGVSRQAGGAPALPLLYTASELCARLLRWTHPSVAAWVRDIVTTMLWYGPLAVFWGAVLWKRLRQERKSKGLEAVDFCFVLGVVWFLAACVGGVTFGFPKYHAPAAAFLTVALAVVLKKAKGWKEVAAGLFVGIFIQFFLLSDTLYFIRFTLREALLSSGGSVAIKDVLPLWILAAGVLLFTFWLFRRAAGPLALGLLIGMNAALSGIQVMAAYDTGYNYGGEGTRAAAKIVHSYLTPGTRALVTDEVLFYAGLPGSRMWPNAVWNDRARFLGAIDDPATTVVAMSLASNSVDQLKLLRSVDVRRRLLKNYDHVWVGVYDVWLKKRL